MKPYLRISGAAVLFLCTTAGSTSGFGQEHDSRLIIDLPNYGDSLITDTRLRGSVRGFDYSISASRAGDHTIFHISLNNRSVSLEIPSRDFHNLDLRTIREGVGQSEPITLSFEVQYGTLGGCFGSVRPRKLLITFDISGTISASSLGNKNCNLVWHELTLSQRAPSIYSVAGPN